MDSIVSLLILVPKGSNKFLEELSQVLKIPGDASITSIPDTPRYIQHNERYLINKS